jgi:hypothetical protein
MQHSDLDVSTRQQIHLTLRQYGIQICALAAQHGLKATNKEGDDGHQRA